MTLTTQKTRVEGKVLICDDDPTYLMLMRDTLEAEGFDVVDASDGITALNKFVEVDPDIVLLDVQMPGLTGFEVCERIRQLETAHETPILMITGADDYESISKAYDLGATDFLPKPIRWPMMAHRVRYMLRSQEAIRNFKRSEERLRYLAYYDSLTGLPNRQRFTEHLEKILLLAEREQYQVGVLFLDLDRFKRINDTLGHDFGDKVLKSVARTLQDSIRNSDMLARVSDHHDDAGLARLGGDEFTLFLSKVTSASDIAGVAQRIIEAVSQPIKIDQYEVMVTPSIGVSVYPDDGETVTNLMKNADIAMYEAKDKGKRCFKFYSDSLNYRALERLQLEESMRLALVNNEFELFYQPQVEAASGRIVSVEALIRWRHPEQGLIPPGEFIPIAEESGSIIELGEWILMQACRQAKKWFDAGYASCGVSVNVSNVQFKRGSLQELVEKALSETGLPAHLLHLELTESAIMTDVEENIERLRKIKDLGVSIAIDDFGTGYSSLNYLKKFPIDILKIDRSFITDLAGSMDDEAIVEAIMALANTLNLGVIAEGVETSHQLSILKDHNCPLIQGYLFSEPLPEQDFINLLQKSQPEVNDVK